MITDSDVQRLIDGVTPAFWNSIPEEHAMDMLNSVLEQDYNYELCSSLLQFILMTWARRKLTQ